MRVLSLGLWLLFLSAIHFPGGTSFAAQEDAAEEDSSQKVVAEEPVEPAGLRNDRILASQLADSDAIWMKAGGTEFLGIFNKDSSGKAAGSLLILPAPGNSPVTPGVLPLLASELPYKGWHTLGISLPQFDFSPPAPIHAKANDANSSNASSSNESATEDTKKDTAETQANTETDKQQNVIPEADKWYTKQTTSNMEKLLERLMAAEAKLLEKGGHYVLLAQGTTAELVLELISSKVIKPAGLITLNIDHPVPQRAGKIPANLAAVKIPVLDIYNMANKQKADKRKLKQFSSSYRQLFIPGNDVNFRGSEDLSLRRIKGWLDKNF